MAATTVGAGLFSLPYVFSEAGWLTGFLYLVLVGACASFAHSLYHRALEEDVGETRLLGLIGKYLGSAGKILGPLVVVGGLTFALVIYLILAGEFSELLRPGTRQLGTFLFWLAGSLPIVLGLRRLLFSELLGIGLMVLVIGIVFLGFFGESFPQVIAFDWREILLPFGPVLFSLAGWTAVEPALDYARKSGYASRLSRRAMTFGTFGAAFLYLLFVVGIMATVPLIAPDTVGGLYAWPVWKFTLVVILGFFAIWTSYIPIGLEIRNSLVYDLAWSRNLASATVFLVPPALLLLGFADFFKVIGLVGGVFLGLEYVFILLVGKKILALPPAKRFLVNLLTAVFALGAVYEIYHFVVN